MYNSSKTQHFLIYWLLHVRSPTQCHKADSQFSVSSVALYFPAIFVHVNIQYINIKMFPVNVPDFNITY